MTRLQIARLRSIWGNHNFDFALSLARGFSGGIISLWDPNAFVRSAIWSDDHFVIVKGFWIRENIEVDWNAVRYEAERNGTVFCPLDASAFNHFIDSNALYEVPLGGLQFTWRNKSGTQFSKLDRFIITNNVLEGVADLKGEVMARGLSDHSPISLMQDKVDFGLTYFKVFDSWFERRDVDDVVKNAWADLSSVSNLNVVSKMRMLIQKLKAWIISSRSSEATRLKVISDQIQALDVTIDAGSAISDFVELRNRLFKEKVDISHFISLDSLQKANIKWDVEGDENSKFFHRTLKLKRRQQHIQGLMMDGNWIVDPSSIKNLFYDFFKQKFGSSGSEAVFNSIQPHYILTSEDVNFLEQSFDDEEIKRAVWIVVVLKPQDQMVFHYGSSNIFGTS
ncbi:uncharacterized protein [Rutidosis leptorrhynchoides]|uniref:uncharacterized protein n=1 Tax=Rutidosis leptorrhynchoides TaxID=125765 RepID=UPI003A99C477